MMDANLFDKSVIVDGKELRFRTIIEEKQWEFLGSKGNCYVVLKNGSVANRERENNLSCNCPSWIFNNGRAKRFCKHCKGIMLSGELDATTKIEVIHKHMTYWGEEEVGKMWS